jgi:hypothetical protein
MVLLKKKKEKEKEKKHHRAHGRAPAQQAQGPEFKPPYHQKKHYKL